MQSQHCAKRAHLESIMESLDERNKVTEMKNGQRKISSTRSRAHRSTFESRVMQADLADVMKIVRLGNCMNETSRGVQDLQADVKEAKKE